MKRILSFQGFEIITDKEIKAVKDVCEYVYIDKTKQAKPKESKISNQENYKNQIYSHRPPPAKKGNFEKEFKRAGSVYRDSAVLVKQFMDKVAGGGGIDAKLAKQAVAECVNSVLHSPDAVLWLSQLKTKDEYTAQHSMNVCVLSIVLGRHVNLSVHELNELGLLRDDARYGENASTSGNSE